MKKPEGKWQWEILRSLPREQIRLHSAGACFFLVLSVFPGLLLLLSILRGTGLPEGQLVILLQSLVPGALHSGAQALVQKALEGHGILETGLSALALLWSSGRGVYGILAGLNAVYGVAEGRGYFRTRLLCMAYALAFFGILVLMLLWQLLAAVLLMPAGRMRVPQTMWLRLLILFSCLAGFFTLMYSALPNRRSRLREHFPGAAAASVLWMGFTALYSLYARGGMSLQAVYGPVYTVAVGMLWLYCCVSIVFYGGALNRYLSQKG